MKGASTHVADAHWVQRAGYGGWHAIGTGWTKHWDQSPPPRPGIFTVWFPKVQSVIWPETCNSGPTLATSAMSRRSPALDNKCGHLWGAIHPVDPGYQEEGHFRKGCGGLVFPPAPPAPPGGGGGKMRGGGGGGGVFWGDPWMDPWTTMDQMCQSSSIHQA